MMRDVLPCMVTVLTLLEVVNLSVLGAGEIAVKIVDIGVVFPLIDTIVVLVSRLVTGALANTRVTSDVKGVGAPNFEV